MEAVSRSFHAILCFSWKEELMIGMAVREADVQSVGLRWEPLAKGEVLSCCCDREGCCTTLTVLNTEENVLEIYQVNVNSVWSSIARIELPKNIALCKIVDGKD